MDKLIRKITSNNEEQRKIKEILDHYDVEDAYDKIGCLLIGGDENDDKWSAPSFNKYKKEEQYIEDRILNTNNTQTGMYKCKDKSCGSLNCTIYQEQTRRADEGMTTFIKCRKCGKRYRI